MKSKSRILGALRATCEHSNPSRAALALVAFTVAAGASAQAQTVLPAHPGPQNNGLTAAGSAIFFDLQALSGNLVVTELTTASSTAAGAAFTVEVFVFSGTALGGPVSGGAGSSPAGWTSLGIASATQGPVSAGVSLPIDIPDIAVTQGQITGVAIRFVDTGSRYYGTGAAPLSVYADANLSLTTGDARSQPFTPSGSWFSSRALVGSVTYGAPVTGPTVYCTAGTTSNGCVSSISGSNSPSVSAAQPCVITIAGVEGQKNGIVFYGIDNSGFAPLAWGAGGSSFLCVKPPTQRTINQLSGGSAGQCDGQLTLDWDAFIAANPSALGAPFAAGEKLYVQGWFRDPPAVKTTSLSDGLELTYLP